MMSQQADYPGPVEPAPPNTVETAGDDRESASARGMGRRRRAWVGGRKPRENPAEKKALEYRKDHRVAAEYPQLYRRAWPRKKALRNQTYRRQVARGIDRALATAAAWDEVAPAIPRRQRSRRAGSVPLGRWVRRKLATRLHRTAWNFFKDPYDSRRHREPFVRFLRSVTEGNAARSCGLAELVEGLLAGQAPMDQPGEFHRYYRLGSEPVRWLHDFFRDEPEWEQRLRHWLAAQADGG